MIGLLHLLSSSLTLIEIILSEIFCFGPSPRGDPKKKALLARNNSLLDTLTSSLEPNRLDRRSIPFPTSHIQPIQFLFTFSIVIRILLQSGSITEYRDYITFSSNQLQHWSLATEPCAGGGNIPSPHGSFPHLNITTAKSFIVRSIQHSSAWLPQPAESGSTRASQRPRATPPGPLNYPRSQP